jgi:hypothetical protein
MHQRVTLSNFTPKRARNPSASHISKVPLPQEDTSRSVRISVAITEHPTQYNTELDYLVHTLAILEYGVLIFEDNITVFRDGILILIVQHGNQCKSR